MIKITQDGALASVSYPERFVSPIPDIESAADLLSAWNSYSGSGGHLYTFTKHPLFDLVVNNSPAYSAFTGYPNLSWLSRSLAYTPSQTEIHFSAYLDKTVEYAQADLNKLYPSLSLMGCLNCQISWSNYIRTCILRNESTNPHRICIIFF